MTRVLVVYSSRHGGTEGIAARIGQVLRAEGLEAFVEPADHAKDVGLADAFVIGSGVYMGSWLNDALDFMRRNEAALAARPVWLFSSGPLPGSSADDGQAADLVTNALGPLDGPGSGGRKKVEVLADATSAREHRVFFGAFDPDEPPRSFSERLVRMMPAAKSVLPAGDFRNWPDIEAWAREIAGALRSPTPVG